MDIFNKLFPKEQKLTQEQLRVQVILKDLSLRELENIAKEFISSNPMIEFKDDDGILQKRKPNRYEYVKGITKNVSLNALERFLSKR